LKKCSTNKTITLTRKRPYSTTSTSPLGKCWCPIQAPTSTTSLEKENPS